jgi:TLD
LSHRLTESFATKCLSPLELYIFKSVFKTHASASSGVSHWTQSTLAKFLDLPDHPGLPIAHVIFQLASYIGAFPFPSQAPAILTNDALLRVLVLLTGRHTKVLRGGRRLWEREIWRGLAVFDRGLEEQNEQSHDGTIEIKDQNTTQDNQSTQGFTVDQIKKYEANDDDDDDELTLAAFDAMDAADVFRHGEMANIEHAMIPTDNFLTLVMFLLLIAPLTPQEPLSTYSAQLVDDRLQDIRNDAYAILTSFGVERNPGISYRIFRKVISATLPHLLDPIQPLFEHFFYSSDFNLHKKQRDSVSSISDLPEQPKPKLVSLRPIMPSPSGDLLTYSTLTHLSFILAPSILIRNLTLLYSGAEDGFSMPTFQNSVFNWSSPTLFLVSGTIMSESGSSARARSFGSSLPYRRFKSSTPVSQKVVYGAYIPVPWKQTHKSGFGTKETLLFQLYPQHDVFSASPAHTSYIYFNRHPSTYTGIGLGSPLPEQNQSSAGQISNMIRRRSSLDVEKVPLGPVSLHMDDSLTYAAFTHDSRGGGSFEPSNLPSSCRLTPSPQGVAQPATAAASFTSPVISPPTSPIFRSGSPFKGGAMPLAAPLADWQDVFEIEGLEVYGLGGDEVLEEQKRQRKWEEVEAERRRGIQMRTGDVDADRELLKLAGLIGEGRSGGSMG